MLCSCPKLPKCRISWRPTKTWYQGRPTRTRWNRWGMKCSSVKSSFMRSNSSSRSVSVYLTESLASLGFSVRFLQIRDKDSFLCVLVCCTNFNLAPAATAKHIVWRRDGSSSSWLLQSGGEGAPQRGVEAVWGTEEKLWEGEEELHRGCYSPGTRSAYIFLCLNTHSANTMCVIITLHFFESFFFSVNPQKKAFQEDRAAWLKNQFLNMTPFTDRRRCSSSDGQSALSISMF